MLSTQAAALPTLAPAALQRSQKPAPNPFVISLDSQFDAPKSPKPNVKKGRAKRFFGFLLLLALVGGAVGASVVYGPELMTLAKGETSEPTAPLAFPEATAVVPVVRTATFTVENQTASDTSLSYAVTTDFETGISQIIIDREDQTQLEILTIFDSAVIRRTDEEVWYRLDRGDLPVDRDLGRKRWVRSLDELFPPGIRGFATIDDASEAILEEESMRHLVVSIDPDRFVIEAPVNPTPVDIAVDPAVEPPDPAAPTEPGAPLPAPDVASDLETPVVAPAAPPALPPGFVVDDTVAPDEVVTIELWVDDSGTIRRLVLPAALGGETVTVASTSPDAWQPQFPSEDIVEPFTASALIHLSL